MSAGQLVYVGYLGGVGHSPVTFGRRQLSGIHNGGP